MISFLVIVFLPILSIQGVIGRLFREFVLTTTFAILGSGFVYLTLTPMLCTKLLKKVLYIIKITKLLYGLKKDILF